MSKRKILVTGGCGYIGSHTILEIIRKTDCDVFSVDNYLNSSEETVQRIKEITGKSIQNYPIDLCDSEVLRNVFKQQGDIAGVIHFAALKSVPDSVADPLGYYKNNLESLLNVVACCEEFAVKSLIFSSSCSVYGNVATLPVKESTPLAGVQSPYAHTKLIGEEILRNIAKKGTLNIIALRYFNPVGADVSGKLGENPINRPNNLVPVITQTAIGIIPSMKVFGSDYDTRDGSCIRDYVHVSDIADAHVKAFEYVNNIKSGGLFDIFNLGTGNGISVLEAIKAFEEVSGVNVNYEVVGRRDGDVAGIYSDSTKAEQLLKWKPAFGVSEMMRTAWAWQKNIAK